MIKVSDSYRLKSMLKKSKMKIQKVQKKRRREVLKTRHAAKMKSPIARIKENQKPKLVGTHSE